MSNVLKGTVMNPEKVYGKSAYEVAVANGFDGTEEEWLYSLAEEANKLAKAYADLAGESAEEAVQANASAGEHEANAKTSEDNAKVSETNAKTSETNAKTSETNAKEYERLADAHRDSAYSSEVNAKGSEIQAKDSETRAKNSETIAITSANNASHHEAIAKACETNAATSANNAYTSEVNAQESESNAQTYAERAEAAAVSAEGYARAAEESNRHARSAINEITNEIHLVGGKNIFNPLNIEQGRYNTTTGEKESVTVENQPYRSAEKIELPNVAQYKVQVFSKNAFTAGRIGVFMYDENGNFVKAVSRDITLDGCIWFDNKWGESVGVKYINFILQYCEPQLTNIINDIDIMVSESPTTTADSEFVPYSVESVEIPKLVLPNFETRLNSVETRLNGAETSIDSVAASQENTNAYLQEIELVGGKNIFNPSNIEPGLFNYDTGEKNSSSATNQPYRSAKKIQLPTDGQYKLQVFSDIAFTSGQIHVWFYDENGGFITEKWRNIAATDGTAGCIWFETAQETKDGESKTARYVNFSLHNCLPYWDDISDINIMISKSVVADGADAVFVPFVAQHIEIPRLKIPSLERRNRYKFNGKMLNIGYSTINFAPINTLENYLSVWKCGFNACKGDVRITYDNKLIMCHDAGFTIIDGLIAADYDSSNQSLIRNMYYDDCMDLRYAAKASYLGYNARVADFESYICICKEKDMIPFITIRDYNIDKVLEVMLPILAKYELTYDCIINSMTYDSLVKLRSVNKDIYATYTLNAGQVATISDVDKCLELGNCGLTIFTEPTGGNGVITSSQEALDYAKSVGVATMNGQVSTIERYKDLIRKGFSGFHINKPILDYSMTEICISVKRSGTSVAMWDTAYGAKRYNATVELNENDGCIEISNIQHQDNTLPFADAILTLWLNCLPYKVAVTNGEGSFVKTVVENGIIKIGATYDDTFNVVISI